MNHPRYQTPASIATLDYFLLNDSLRRSHKDPDSQDGPLSNHSACRVTRRTDLVDSIRPHEALDRNR